MSTRDRMDALLAEQVRRGKTPSVQYILFDKDRILKQYRYGLADIKASRPVDDATTYNAFSVTKTFTALAVLQLAHQGKIDIDSPVIDYLPSFPYFSDSTVRQVLSHSAGIPNPIPLNWIHLPPEHPDFNRNAFFKNIFLKHNQVKSQPNETFAYSNLGYVLLGQLIEAVSGLSYENYITTHIIRPLHLPDTDLGFLITVPDLHASGYQKRFSFLNLLLTFFIDKKKFMGPPENGWVPFRHYFVNGAPYGGLIGKPSAFVKYIQELLNPEQTLIPPTYAEQLFQENRTNNGHPTGMCLSWFKSVIDGHPYHAHAGGGGGYYCEIRLYREDGLGSVVFLNRTGIKDERFLDKLDAVYFAENTTKKAPGVA